jgi:predicted TPR repeat methyltransferase
VDESDLSNGWEAVAEKFIVERSGIGPRTVQAWASSLREGAAIVDLGCGSGVPISEALIDAEFTLYGIDVSPSMVAAFRTRFPDVPVACEAVEHSAFFDRTFDGAVAWGLMFLLPGDTQRALVHRVAQALNAGGRFIFTAPSQACSWPDATTGMTSLSLGANAYRAVLADAGLTVVGEGKDGGENHYYEAQRIGDHG